MYLVEAGGMNWIQTGLWSGNENKSACPMLEAVMQWEGQGVEQWEGHHHHHC